MSENTVNNDRGSYWYSMGLPPTLQTTVLISLAVVFILSLLDLAGWIFNITLLKSIEPQWIPMKVITAICLVFSGLAVVLIQTGLPVRLRTWLVRSLAAFITVVSLITIIDYLHIMTKGHETNLSGMPLLNLLLLPENRMAFLTAFNLLFIGSILFLLSGRNNLADNIAHLLIFPVGLASYFVPVSYILNVYSMIEFGNITVALNTGIAFIALSTALIMIRPNTWLMKVFTGRNTGAIMARRLLPGLILIPIIIAWVRIYGEHSNLFRSEVGVALVALTYTACFILLIWFTARSVNQIDDKRRRYEEELIKSRIVETERKRFNDVLDLMPAYIVLLTPDYHVPYANRYFRERFGKADGRRCYEYLFNRTEPCEVCDTYKVLSDNEPHTWEWLGPDGRNYSIYDFPFADANGSPLIMEMGIDVTVLKQAEAKLQSLNSELELRVAKRTADLLLANEKLRRTQEFAHLGSWELDLVNNELSWSDEVYRIFGLIPKEFVATYEAFLDTIHPDDREKVDKAYSNSIKEGSDQFEIEHRIIQKHSGEIRYIHEKFAHLRNGEGLIVRFVGMIQDITDAIKAREALVTSESNLRAVLDATQESVYMFDRQGNFVVSNLTGAKRLNLSPSEFIGHPFAEFMTEDLARERFINLNKVFGTGKPLQFEDERNGMIFNHNFYPVFENDLVTRVVTYSQEITKRKKAENDLILSRQEWMETFDMIPDLIAIIDTKHRILRANKAMLDKIGVSAPEATGTPCYKCVHGTQSAPSFCPHTLTLLDGKQHIAEIHEEKLGGDFLVSNTPMFDNSGNLIGSVHVARDITERKKAEKALRDYSMRLEIISDTANRLLASENPRKLVNELCSRVMKFLDCQVFINYLVDETAGKLHLNDYTGIPEYRMKKIEWLDFGTAICGIVAQEGKRIVAENISDTPDPGTDLIKSFGITAYACHPLLSMDKVIGTISFGTRSRATFSDDDLSLMEAVANQVAIALSRIRVEKELIKTRNYLENLINYSNTPIIVWTTKYKIQLFNHAFEYLTGYTSTEVVGKKLDLLFPKSSSKESKKKITLALTENLKNIEIPIQTKNLKTRTVLWNSAKIYDSDRKFLSTIAQGNDITERLKAEKAVEKAKEKLEIALENGNIGIWQWDFRTDTFEWDERMKRMFGLEPGSLENTYDAFEQHIFEEDLPHMRIALRQAIEKGIPLETIFRIRLKNDDINYISTKALVEKDNNGKPIIMSGVCFDITEMKKGTEKALFRLNEDLLRSNRELEQFAYVASHDLQEPLRMVSSFTQLLSQRYKDKLDQDAQQFIKFAVDGANRMQILINDLLEYSRIETRGKKFSDIDMHNILGHTIKNLNLRIKEKNALVTNDELPVLSADEGQMVQLFQNLIGNALKFCKKSPRIHISAKEETEHYLFSVKDNGIGIESQYFNKVFKIFQRLQPKEAYEGTGIGLAICKRIVERHGGEIWVESKPGKGSTFYFTIIKSNNSGK